MKPISDKGQELLDFMKADYIVFGYMYSGSWPFDSLVERGFGKEQIHELRDAGCIQKRDCDDYAFELVSLERKKLIAEHDLCSVWYEKYGNGLLLEIQNEARSAANLLKDEEGLTVSTLKRYDDVDSSNLVKVKCPFSVGQVLTLEYDLPHKLQWKGHICAKASSGVKIGQFIVTDVLRNLLVYPRMNMIELQSLDKEFNSIYPTQRTLVVFEDLALKRTKSKPSLDEKIESASDKASLSGTDYKDQEMNR